MVTDDRACSARFRLGDALFFEVQSPEVPLAEVGPPQYAGWPNCGELGQYQPSRPGSD
jgi:hypothetical protein